MEAAGSGKRKSIDEDEVYPKGFSVMSWNINGIRTINMKETVGKLKSTILAVQETKISRHLLEGDQALVKDHSSYFAFSKNRPGYSGVGTYCHDSFLPLKAEEGITGLTLEPYMKSFGVGIGSYCVLEPDDLKNARYGDMDGRAVITQHHVMTPRLPDVEYGDKMLNVINVYCPCLRDDPSSMVNNTEFKLSFHSHLAERARKLVEAGEFVLILGDLNVSHKMIDQSDIDDPSKFCQTEFRKWLDDLLSPDDPNGFVDTFRSLHPTQQNAFTCWSTKLNARENNFGARIDYILADKQLAKYLDKAEIHPDIMGSDHCPVSASFHSLSILSCDRLLPMSSKSFAQYAGRQQTLEQAFRSNQAINTKLERNMAAKRADKHQSGNACKKPKQMTLNSFITTQPKQESAASVEGQNDNTSSISNPGSSGSSTKTPGFFKEINSNASQEWKQLLKTPPTPLCTGHNELSVLRTVKKKGPNYGSQFWSCNKGLGKKGDPNASCEFFQWVNPKK